MKPGFFAKSQKGCLRGSQRCITLVAMLRAGELTPDDFVAYVVRRVDLDSETRGFVCELAEQLAREIGAKGQTCA